MKVGILGLQGCIEPHAAHLAALGAKSITVRDAAELSTVDRLIIPGGESTTMLRLLETLNLWDALLQFTAEKPVWGVCAGAILLSREVSHPEQRSLAAIDTAAIRNFYGSQRESFIAPVRIEPINHTLEGYFIRAPLLRTLPPVRKEPLKVLARHDGEPVLLRQGRILVSSFHSELGSDPALHRYFISDC